MSPALIVTLIIVGIVVMVGAAVIAQSVENNRKERQRKIAIINERIRNLSGMISDIPNNYMTADLRQFLINVLKQSCSAILALDAGHSDAKQQLQQLEALSQQPYQDELDTIKAPFNDAITGQGIRARIKDLVNTIVAMNKEGSLNKSTAVKYINQGKVMFQLVSVDLTLIAARAAEQGDKNIKVAAIHYNNILKKLNVINTNGMFNKRVEYTKAKLQQVKEKVEAANQQQRPADTDNKDEWDQFQTDNDWQIKQDYDS